MSVELSEVDTEFILEHFHDLQTGEFSDLAAALRDLNAMPETLAPSQPPLLPSQVLKNVKPFKRSIRRNITTAFVATAIAASTTLGAAALTGVGPKPLVDFAKTTFKAIGSVGAAVVDIVTSPLASTTPPVQNSNSALPIPAAGEEDLFNVEGDSDSDNVSTDPKSVPSASASEDIKVQEQRTESVATTTEDHAQAAVATPEVEHSMAPTEKPEVKASEVPEVKVSEKPEVKVSEKPEVKPTPVPEVKVSENPEPKPTSEAKQSPEPVESKSSTETKDT